MCLHPLARTSATNESARLTFQPHNEPDFDLYRCKSNKDLDGLQLLLPSSHYLVFMLDDRPQPQGVA